MERENGSPVKITTKFKRGKKGRTSKTAKLSSELTVTEGLPLPLPVPAPGKPLEAVVGGGDKKIENCDDGGGDCESDSSYINGTATGPLWRDSKSTSMDVDGESTTSSRISNDENLMPPPGPLNLTPAQESHFDEDIDHSGNKSEVNSERANYTSISMSPNELIVDGFSIFGYSSEQEVEVSRLDLTLCHMILIY